MRKEKKKVVSTRVPISMVARIKRMAEADQRTFSSQVWALIQEAVEARIGHKDRDGGRWKA
jgi:hypothetical protein